MAHEEFDRILKHTLADYRVSRGERRMLESILDEMGPDDQQLAFLRHRAFEIARVEVPGPQAHAVLEWLEEVIKALQPRLSPAAPEAQAYFSPGDACLNAISHRLDSAKRGIDICVFTITDDRIADRIRDAHVRRVEVRIISDNDKAEDIGSDIQRLESLGVPVRVDRTSNHMHHKYAIFDNSALITGSYNWTRSAAKYNEENIVVTQERGLVRQFVKHFESLWQELGS